MGKKVVYNPIIGLKKTIKNQLLVLAPVAVTMLAFAQANCNLGNVEVAGGITASVVVGLAYNYLKNFK